MLQRYVPTGSLAVTSLVLAGTVVPSAFAQGVQGVFAHVRIDPRLDGINTPFERENGFVLSPDGLTAYFTRRHNFDIWRATREDARHAFSAPEHLGYQVNADVIWDYAPTVTDDGLVLLHTRRDPPLGGVDQVDTADIYRSTRTSEDMPFGVAEKLPPPINSPVGDGHPQISGDGLFLIFTSNRPGSRGVFDLWVTTRSSRDEEFGEPVNLDEFWPGSQVNTEGYEAFPFLTEDRLTLLFADAGDRSGGRGSFDLWVTTRSAPDEPFGQPVNLDDFWPGSEINSPRWDSHPFLSRDWPAMGAQLYFASDRAGVKSQEDIWQATWFTGDCLAEETGGPEDRNRNGVLDSCETLFERGNANGDERLDISDAIFTLGYLFLGRREPSCQKAADTNDDGVLDTSDAVFLLDFLFRGSATAPSSPAFGSPPRLYCGIDQTPDELSCESYGRCE